MSNQLEKYLTESKNSTSVFVKALNNFGILANTPGALFTAGTSEGLPSELSPAKTIKLEAKVVEYTPLPFNLHFYDIVQKAHTRSRQERNSIISLAYSEDWYSQIEIANYLGLSKSTISMVIKNSKSGD